MFPWFAFGHFTPFLHLSNKLVERGHSVSFSLPKGAQAKLQHLIHYPNLINFYPLLVPQVDGLPPGVETTPNVPFPLHAHLCVAFDQTQDQVETILSSVKHDFIFYDFSLWMPTLARQLGNKAIYYAVYSAAAFALAFLARRILEDLIQLPPDSVQTKSKEFQIAQLKILVEDHGTGMSFYF